MTDPEAYWKYHHKLCHNLMFGLLLSVVLTLLSRRRWKLLFIYLGLFHLHLMLDYFGSGPGWRIFYLWPFSNWSVGNPKAWPFYSWQNISAMFVCMAWVLVIAVQTGRTPLETIMPHLDKLVERLRKITKNTGRGTVSTNGNPR